MKLNDEHGRESIGCSPKNLPTNKIFLPEFSGLFSSLPEARAAFSFGRAGGAT
jgi:hypothetical protein